MNQKIRELRFGTNAQTLVSMVLMGHKMGWQDRDAHCAQHYCSKCARKDAHTMDEPSEVEKAAAADRAMQAICAQLERQIAQDRTVLGSEERRPLLYGVGATVLAYADPVKGGQDDGRSHRSTSESAPQPGDEPGQASRGEAGK